jgi:hypothetical protein
VIMWLPKNKVLQGKIKKNKKIISKQISSVSLMKFLLQMRETKTLQKQYCFYLKADRLFRQSALLQHDL